MKDGLHKTNLRRVLREHGVFVRACPLETDIETAREELIFDIGEAIRQADIEGAKGRTSRPGPEVHGLPL
ncbi:hypothetical protein LCGC14_1612810 [marine sediment metagenome]|uniref:Uncharacterized protein n=1 Tax=marine sediment metagenome TaxID=412755 RepID=A0A0F9IUJ9_9ZZZZ